ncbi:MAG: oxidoreductase [Treponema sp.]|nr:oxidoreductase [Treponema sp.]
MSKLCITLPPLAPDYSGVASALFDMGGMVVIHDASGCTGNYLGYDEPRWMGSSSNVFCSGLRHMDAVLGRDEKYIKIIVEAINSLHPKFFAFLGSPVPMVIGTDYKGIAEEVENITGVPSFGFDTKGLDYYDNGASMAMIEALKKFVPGNGGSTEAGKSAGCEKNGINILGVIPLDFGNKGNDCSLRKAFENEGIKVNAVFSMGLSIEELKKSVESKLNVVVSQAGIKVAEFMKRKYGMPFVIALPLGQNNNQILKIKELLKTEECSSDGLIEENLLKVAEASADCAGCGCNSGTETGAFENVLIAGEQVFASAVRKRIVELNPKVHAEIAVIYTPTEKYLENYDKVCRNESELRALINSDRYQKVVADPMVEQLIKNKTDVKFYRTPHPALSSKLHWNEMLDYFSPEMEQFLKTIVL